MKTTLLQASFVWTEAVWTDTVCWRVTHAGMRAEKCEQVLIFTCIRGIHVSSVRHHNVPKWARLVSEVVLTPDNACKDTHYLFSIIFFVSAIYIKLKFLWCTFIYLCSLKISIFLIFPFKFLFFYFY